jgi:hypothetical protein
MSQEDSTPMKQLFEYIEDGTKLHNIVSMKSLFMQYERVWLAKHLSQASNTDKADEIINRLYNEDK